MASADIAEAEASSSRLDDEGRDTEYKEGKKSRKFKPLEAMRKLFKTGRKRMKSKDDPQMNVVAVKAKSTTALTSAGSLDEDDDSDGGFKSSHNKQRSLRGGQRSISEDSVFNPGDRTDGASISALKTVAVSEENIHKNAAFQTELFSKLKQRHSQYSEDEDDGLPQSPIPQVTTADLLTSGSLQPHPGKSSSRESEKSLISVDGSDNEIDDLFFNKGRSSDKSPSTKGTSMDFDTVKSSHALDNTAALHKRSIKPHRRGKGQARKDKTRETTPTPSGLPSLNEESLTNTEAKETVVLAKERDVASPTVSSKISEATAVSATKSVTSISKVKSVAKPAINSKQSVETASMSVKPAPSTRTDTMVEASASTVASAAVKHGRSLSVKNRSDGPPAADSSELSNAFSKMNRRSVKIESDDVEKAGNEKEAVSFSHKKISVSDTKKVLDVPQSLQAKSETVKRSDEECVHTGEGTRPVSRQLTEIAPLKHEITSGKTVNERTSDNVISKPSAVDVKQEVRNPLAANQQPDSSVVGSGKKEGVVPSPRGEEYKQKRANRSKTLPEQPVLPEEYSAKVQRTKSQRNDFGNVNASSPKKIEPKRTSLHETMSTAAEPEWMAAIRKRKAESSEARESKNLDKKTVSSVETNNVPKESSDKAAPDNRLSKPLPTEVAGTKASAEIKKTEIGVSKFGVSKPDGSTSVSSGKTLNPVHSSSSKYVGSVQSAASSPDSNISTTRASSVYTGKQTTSGLSKMVTTSSSSAPSSTSVSSTSSTAPLVSSSTKTSSSIKSVSVSKPEAVTAGNIPKTSNVTSSSTAKATNVTPSNTTKPTYVTSSSTAKATNVTPSNTTKPTYVTSSSTAKATNVTLSNTTKPTYVTSSSTDRATNVAPSNTTKPTYVTSSNTTKPTYVTSSSTTKSANVDAKASSTKFDSPTSPVAGNGAQVVTASPSSTSESSMKSAGVSIKDTKRDPSRKSSREEETKVMSRTQSVKTTSSTETNSRTGFGGGIKPSASVKHASSSSVKGSVQSTDSSGDKPNSPWKSRAGKIQIEIIEKDPTPKQPEVTMRKKSALTPPSDDSLCHDNSAANRSSKVLDMVKNFQKLQVS